MQHYTTYRGDTWSFDLAFTDNLGAVINITGWILYLTLKARKSDADAQAVASKDVSVHADPVNGKSLISLSHTETANLEGVFYFDMQYVKPDGTVKTFNDGEVEFLPNITQRS